MARYVTKTGPDQGSRGVVVFQTLVTQVGGSGTVRITHSSYLRGGGMFYT